MGAFVSYSHIDKKEVSHIVDIILSKTEVNLWYDAELKGGDRYFSVIAREIREKDTFIFMVSKNSVTSNWCLQELQFAMSEQKKIIAVWLEKIVLPAEVKFIIQNTHYVLWENKTGVKSLRKGCEVNEKNYNTRYCNSCNFNGSSFILWLW